MEGLYERLEETAAVLRERLGDPPDLAIVLGSGLGPLADEIEAEAVIPYGELPHFPISTAPGHEGKLVVGRLAGKRVLAYKGRVHYYEGYPMDRVVFPVRAGFAFGVRRFLLTSAAGGLNPLFSAGELMLHADYINMIGDTPLRGPNDERLGPRFPVMFDAYDRELRAAVRAAALAEGIPLREGVYVAIAGPNFASRAELRMLRGFGADAIGMSTVPEVIALRHLGARVVAISTITDMALPDRDHHATEEEVLAVAERTGAVFRRLVKAFIARL